MCWDTYTKAVSSVPAGEFVQAAVLDGRGHCALGADAAVRCWNWEQWLPMDPPDGEFTKVAAGEEHACAIRTDATVVCWGSNAFVLTLEPNPDEWEPNPDE